MSHSSTTNGIDKRKTPRVPIVGVVHFKYANETVSFRVTTIGEGGFGLLHEGQDLSSIAEFQEAYLQSFNLEKPVNCRSQYLYRDNDGYMGFRFVEIGDDQANHVKSYVHQFSAAAP